VFAGFLPSRPTERRKKLRELAAELRTLALYEAPHRLLDTLEDALEILGNRPAAIAREITKIYEEFVRGHIEDLIAAARHQSAAREITLLIGPPDGQPPHASDAANPRNAVPLCSTRRGNHEGARCGSQGGVEAGGAGARPDAARGLQAVLITRDDIVHPTLQPGRRILHGRSFVECEGLVRRLCS